MKGLKTSFIAIAIAFLAFSLNASAKHYLDNNIRVGAKPVLVHYDERNDLFHVFCAGHDANYDGVFDEATDEIPTWWAVTNTDGNWQAELKYEFEFNSFNMSGAAFRPAIIPAFSPTQPQLIYIPHDGYIASYNMDTFTQLNANAGDIDAYAISPSGPTHLFLSLRNGENPYTDPGEVIVYNPLQQNILQTVEAGVNVGQTLYYDPADHGISFAILNEGGFGANNSTLQIGEIVHMGDFDLKTLELGDGGNHLYVHGDSMYVCVNASHELKIVDLNKKEIVRSINVPTLGFDGPRESRVFENHLYVSTFDGTIFKYRLPHFVLEQVIVGSDKIEALDFAPNGDIVAAAPYKRNSYEPNYDVNIIRNFGNDDSEYLEGYFEERMDFVVGHKPIYAYFGSNGVNVFCQGDDLNGNGVFDDGEIPSSWWVGTEEMLWNSNEVSFEKKLDFDYFLPDEFNPAVNHNQNIIYINHVDRIASYNTETFTMIDDMFDISSSGLSLSGPSHLFVSIPGDGAAPDRVEVKAIQTANVLQTVEALAGVSQNAYYQPVGGGINFAVLNKGVPGENNSVLQIGPILHMQDFELEEIPVGDNANKFSVTEFVNGITIRIYVTSQGSHEIHTIDAEELEVIETLSTSEYTQGDDGPRETRLVFNGESGNAFTATSSFSGDMLIHNLAEDFNGFLPVSLPGKGDALFFYQGPVPLQLNDLSGVGSDHIGVTIPYKKNSNVPLDMVTVFKVFTQSSVRENEQNENSLVVYPNPAVNSVQIKNPNSIMINGGKLFNSYGLQIADFNSNDFQSIIALEKYGLSNGAYFMQLETENGILTVPFNVIK